MISLVSKRKICFFNKPLLSDVCFRVSGKLLYAHRAVLMARCDVMSAMLSGRFAEAVNPTIEINDTTWDAYLAMFEYFYTDHAPVSQTDAVGLMVVANRHGLSRLVTLCELFLSKLVEKRTANDITKADIDLIGMLNCAQTHNAKQLAAFLLHFISSNYQPMKKRADFATLSEDNRKYIEENQWPPKPYLLELEAYENATGKKCLVM